MTKIRLVNNLRNTRDRERSQLSIKGSPSSVAHVDVEKSQFYLNFYFHVSEHEAGLSYAGSLNSKNGY